jgi:hypothetical protein
MPIRIEGDDAMPPTLSKPSGAAPASLVYITLGALMSVWSGIWFMYLRNNAISTRSGQFYVCMGFLVTGIVLVAIGLGLGPLSRMARHAELPPQEVTDAAVQSEKAAAPRRT